MSLATAATGERISYEQLFSIIRLSLATKRKLYPQSTLHELGVDEIDFADILFQTHVPFSHYFSAGSNTLTHEGRLVVAEAACDRYVQGDVEAGNALAHLRNKKIDQLLEELTLNDLYHIVNSL